MQYCHQQFSNVFFFFFQAIDKIIPKAHIKYQHFCLGQNEKRSFWASSDAYRRALTQKFLNIHRRKVRMILLISPFLSTGYLQP